MILIFLYMILLALFNLSDLWCDTGLPSCFYEMDKCYIYNSAGLYLIIFLTLGWVLWKQSKLIVGKDKRIVYRCASIISFVYCVWATLAGLSWNIGSFLNKIESFVWTTIIIFVIILLLCYLLYNLMAHD